VRISVKAAIVNLYSARSPPATEQQQTSDMVPADGAFSLKPVAVFLLTSYRGTCVGLTAS